MRNIAIALAFVLLLVVPTACGSGVLGTTNLDTISVSDLIVTDDVTLAAGTNFDLNGGDFTIDADGDTVLDETSDDNIRLTSGAATGLWNVLTGNLKVGNGTPGVTLNGEDAYVEGTLEVDGAATFDGGATFATADMNGTVLTIGADGGVTLDETSDDVVAFSLGAGSGTLSVLTGNLKVGNGTPTTSQDGEDLYVEGYFENDGNALFDGVIYANGTIDTNGTKVTMDADADSWLDESADDVIDMTLGGASGYWNVLTGNMKIGNGTPGVTLDGEDAYVEGTLEIDGASTFDGGATFNAADMNGTKLTMDADADSWADESADDIIDLVVGAATGYWNVLTGNLKVGNGTPDVTMDGEDAYVEGTLEVDGASRFDGAVVNNSTTQLVGAVNLDGAVDLDGVVTNAANLEHMMWPTYATTAFTYTAAAGGTVPLFTIAANEVWYVHDLRLNVTTNWDAEGNDVTIDIGTGDDVDGLCVLLDAELQAADTEGTGWAAGWQCQVAATRGVFLDGTGGFIVLGGGAGETIDAVIDETSGETLTAGAATAYLVYTRLQ